MLRYNKGARSERELLGIFHDLGYSVIRSAGSGVNALSPDIIAIKNSMCIAIECKAWNKNMLALNVEQYMKLIEWEANTKFPTFIAWRMNGKGWYFIKLNEFKKSPTNFTVTKKVTLALNRTLNDVLALDTAMIKG